MFVVIGFMYVGKGLMGKYDGKMMSHTVFINASLKSYIFLIIFLTENRMINITLWITMVILHRDP